MVLGVGYNIKITSYPAIAESEVKIFQHGIVRKPKETKQIIDLNKIRTKEEIERSITSSLNRTKNTIYDYARANRWEWFLTLTFSPEKVDRYNYDECTKKLKNWIDNSLRRKNKDLKYIFVPERHDDGAFHFHGLVSNIAEDFMVDSDKKTKQGDTIFNLSTYRLGWTTATKVKDTARAANYITKYITKELLIHTKNKRRYWPSKNLNIGEIQEMNITDIGELENFYKEIKKMTTREKVVEVDTKGYKNKIYIMQCKIHK